jgi:hypothetical protein
VGAIFAAAVLLALLLFCSGTAFQSSSPIVGVEVVICFVCESLISCQHVNSFQKKKFSAINLVQLKANKPTMQLDDHERERGIKLLYALDRKVWEVKVNAIQESTTLDTLTVDELFSKLKSSKLDNQLQAKLRNPSAPSVALVSGKTSSSSSSNPSLGFSLSALVSVTKEQLECLGDDELALIIGRFSRFHNNRLNRRRGGGPKEGCFGCGDPDHYIASCLKKNKQDAGKRSSDRFYTNKYDSSKHKDRREYSSGKPEHKAKKFDKEYIKRKYIKKKKAEKHAFLASLSDLEDSDAKASSSDDEAETKIEEKLNGLCFFADAKHGGFCTMALGDEASGNGNMFILAYLISFDHLEFCASTCTLLT